MNLNQITTQLLSDDASVCLAALSALEERSDPVPLPSQILDGLLHCLGHSRKVVQRGAAAQLVRFARLQPEVVTALIAKLSDQNPRVRWTAAFALSQIDLPEPMSLPVLVENLGHQESDLRWAAATAMVRLAAQHPIVVEELLRLASTGNVVQRRMALYCLRDLEQTTPAAQTVYLTSLSDPDPLVRLGGLSCWGKLKLTISAVRARLLRMLVADPDPGVRRATAVTIGQLNDHAPEVLEVLARATRSDDAALSKAATGALERLRATVPSPPGRGLS